tara:strand:- start:152 stop:352 length:201 start_codon:yes stop_codon:yes gene_type:complete
MLYKTLTQVEYSPLDENGNPLHDYWRSWDVGSIIDVNTIKVPDKCKPLYVGWLLEKKAIEEVDPWQ